MNQLSDNSELPDDVSLICQTLTGQTDAFAQLVRKYQDRLFHGLMHVLRNRADAEEALQEALIKAYTKLDTFKGESQFFTWLYRIAHNTAISQLRRRRPTVSLDGADADDGTFAKLEVPEDAAMPSDQIERQEQSELLHDALGRLSVEHRSVLVLREMDGLDYEAIAEVLQTPVGTVRSRLHRARCCLKTELERNLAKDEL